MRRSPRSSPAPSPRTRAAAGRPAAEPHDPFRVHDRRRGALSRARRGACSPLDALGRLPMERPAVTGRLSITAPVLFGQLLRWRRLPALARPVRRRSRPRVAARQSSACRSARRASVSPCAFVPSPTRRCGRASSVTCAEYVCATPLLARPGVPRTPEALARHACVSLTPVPSRPPVDVSTRRRPARGPARAPRGPAPRFDRERRHRQGSMLRSRARNRARAVVHEPPLAEKKLRLILWRRCAAPPPVHPHRPVASCPRPTCTPVRRARHRRCPARLPARSD